MGSWPDQGPRETSFGALLRRFRAMAMLSQEALAERAGLSLRAISDLERGVRTRPYLETVRMLADALALTGDDRAALVSAARPGVLTAARSGHIAEVEESVRSLPAPATTLVGRSDEINQVVDLLRREEVRLVTLTGPAGVGKTRLAIAVAWERQAVVPDDVRFVDLTEVADAGMVLSRFAQELGLRDERGDNLIERVQAFFCDRTMLVVLDNFEHVIAAAADVARLLSAAPHLKVIVTSRVRLNLSVEYEFPVSPLALPAKESRASVSDALESPAVRLFLDRAEAVRFYFVLTDEIAPIISALCERLDGIPLAIELAAAQVRLLSPARLLEQMHQRFAVLRSDQLDRPARHQSLQEAIAWSYNLLTVGEQVLFRRLGVFMGGMTTEAAEAVAGLKPGAGLDALTALADKSLLQVGTGALDEPRFWMLETIREFALERLRLSGEASITNFRHFNFYLDAAATAGAHLTSRDQDDWLDRLEIEHQNFREAIDWACDKRNTSVLRLGSSLWIFWIKRGHWTEGRRALDRILAIPGANPSIAGAEALLGAGAIAGVQGDLASADVLFRKSLSMSELLHFDVGRAHALTNLGICALHRCEYADAIRLLRESLALYVPDGDEAWAAAAISYLGVATILNGEVSEGLSLCDEGLTQLRKTGDWWAFANTSLFVADTLAGLGDYPRATTTFLDGLGRWDDFPEMRVWLLAGLIGVASTAEQHVLAGRLVGALEATSERLEVDLWPFLEHRVDAASAAGRSALGVARFEIERLEGTLLTPDEMLAHAKSLAT